MKYWILTTEYPPQFGGGIGTYCYQWCRQLLQQRVDTTVFLMNKSVSGYRESRHEGVRIIEFSPYLEDVSAFLGYETSVSVSFEKIVRLFIEKEGSPDWIESQEYNGLAYYLLQRKHLGYEIYRDVNFVINCHCPSFIAFEFNHINTYQLPYFWIGEMERFCLKAADICISPSQYLVDLMVKRHPELNRKFIILKNPLEAENNLLVATDKPLQEAVFYGKLSPIKGILELLKAFSHLWDEGHAGQLSLVGDEYYYYHGAGSFMGKYIRKKYERYIQKGLLKLKGAVSPDKLNEAIGAAKFVVLPSAFDNFPYAVLEMMIREKVILASDSGGHREILQHKENGLLYHSGDIEDLKQKIQQAFSLQEEEMKRLGTNAARAVRQFCNPGDYFTKKMQFLREHEPAGQDTIFPFLQINRIQSALPDDPIQERNGLLSVVIPFYNMGAYIQDTIDSIRASAYKKIEIIIIDDGSQDTGSLAKLEELKTQPGITLVRQQNKGLPQARNEGAAHAKGEFLAFLDPDDMVAANYYSFATDILTKKSNVHFVGCWVQYFGTSDNSWPSFTPEPPYLLFHNMINSSGLVYRRKSFLTNGQNDPAFVYGMEDYDSIISLAEKGMGGVVIPERLFMYRVRKDSMARGFNKSNMAYSYQLLTEKHKHFYATFATEITNLLTANGPGYNCENPTLDYHLYPTKSMQSYLVRKLISGIKRQPLLRRVAASFYKRLKLYML